MSDEELVSESDGGEGEENQGDDEEVHEQPANKRMKPSR